MLTFSVEKKINKQENLGMIDNNSKLTMFVIMIF